MMKTVVLQVRVLWERTRRELNHMKATSPFPHCPYSLPKPSSPKEKETETRKKSYILYQTEIFGDSSTHSCLSLPRIKINPWNCALRNKEEARELSELESQDIHLFWAHFMSAVDKMSTDQGECNGVSKHGRLLQCHSKHLLKGTKMKAVEKED